MESRTRGPLGNSCRANERKIIMSEIVNVVKALPKLACVGKTADSVISDAERQLQLSFAAEYKEYLAEFGAISAKRIELTGIIGVEYCNVVYATRQAWELNPRVPHSMYVVENTYVDGIIIWQDVSGTIYQSTPSTEPKQIAVSMADYIVNRTNK